MVPQEISLPLEVEVAMKCNKILQNTADIEEAWSF